MKINYEVEHYDYNKRYRNLDIEAQGVVKSQKFFPVFLNNGKEEIFKPLSKTKPLSTPLFAYSEVFWSTVINKYFDNTTPIYRLATCDNYTENIPKYYNYGTIVPSVLDNDEKLVNLLEYFKDNKDPNVDIDNYVNYCMQFYDYTPIFNSKIIMENNNLGEQLAKQVLISILKADQNYHYENVSFVYKNDKLVHLSPPIDHEFSTMFLYPDNLEKHKYEFNRFISKLKEDDDFDNEMKIIINLIRQSLPTQKTTIEANLDIIVERYKEVTLDFLEKLELFTNDLKSNPIKFEDNSYIEPFNSKNYKAGIEKFKNNNPELAEKILNDLSQKNINIESYSQLVQEEIIKTSTSLKQALLNRLDKNKVKTKK